MSTYYCKVCDHNTFDPLTHIYTPRHQKLQLLFRARLAMEGKDYRENFIVRERDLQRGQQ